MDYYKLSQFQIVEENCTGCYLYVHWRTGNGTIMCTEYINKFDKWVYNSQHVYYLNGD